MGSRLDLQTKLEAVLGSRNVYFQPPESIKMKYPAIVYSLADMITYNADNKKYITGKNYTVTLIHTNPDNIIADDLLTAFTYISLDRVYVADNLYHYAYEIVF